MPEGPSILLLRNKLLAFKGKMVREAGGYGVTTETALMQLFTCINVYFNKIYFLSNEQSIKIIPFL